MKFTRRHTIIYDLPLPEGTIILRPEFVIVRFPNGQTADIGSLCYIKRESAPKLYQAGRRSSNQGLTPVEFEGQFFKRMVMPLAA